VPPPSTRFCRGDPARSRPAPEHDHSTGLGLAIARAAADAHGGSLRFAGNAPGAVFELRLPACLKEL
jgi:signal transduction histidine kinase